MTSLVQKLPEIKEFLEEINFDDKQLTETVNLLPGEIRIAIENVEIGGRWAKEYIDSSKSFFSIKNSIDLNPYALSIKIEHIEKLRILPESKPQASGIEWIGGIRLTYALDATNNFILYFTPLYFKKIGLYYSQGNEVHGLFEIIEESNKFWDYNSDGFNFIDTSIPANLELIQNNIKRYKDQINGIFIQRKEGAGNKKPFASGDVQSILYTFQEFLALSMKGDTKINEVKLWNYVKRVLSNTGTLIKHDIMLSTDDVYYNNEVHYDILSSSFLDLSHLCPPHCSDIPNQQILFRLYQ